MEKITGFLAIFIFLYLIYSYIKRKKYIENKEVIIKDETTVENKESDIFLEKHALVAAIAAVMDGKKYKIRNIFLEKNKNNKSAWKISGRHYNMQRRDRV